VVPVSSEDAVLAERQHAAFLSRCCVTAQAFAMMGTAAGSGGVVTVTDDDVIEKSNLSRQFLFRDWNIGRCSAVPPSAHSAAGEHVPHPVLQHSLMC